MNTVLTIKCEKCGKTYFSQTPKDPAMVSPDEMLEIFKFQLDENKHMTCPNCYSDSIEVP